MKDRKLLNIELGRVTAQQYKELPGSGIAVVLDNVRSAHNVGSAFRSSDAFKIDKIWLCGICATPPSAEIQNQRSASCKSCGTYTPSRYSFPNTCAAHGCPSRHLDSQ